METHLKRQTSHGTGTLQNRWHVSSPRQDDYPLWFSTVSGGWSFSWQINCCQSQKIFFPLNTSQVKRQTWHADTKTDYKKRWEDHTLCLFPVCCLNVLFLWCAGYFFIFIFCYRHATFEFWADIAIPLPRFQHHQGQSFATARWAHITTTAHRVQDCCHTTQRSSQHGRTTHPTPGSSVHIYVRITMILMLQADTTHADKSRSSLLTTPSRFLSIDAMNRMSRRHTL